MVPEPFTVRITPKPKQAWCRESQKSISSLLLIQRYFKGIFIYIISFTSHFTSYLPNLTDTYTQVTSLLCLVNSIFQVERRRQCFEYKAVVVVSGQPEKLSGQAQLSGGHCRTGTSLTMELQPHEHYTELWAKLSYNSLFPSF